MNAYLDGMRRFTDFRGRATPAQFWQFVLAVVVLLLTAAFLDGVFDLRVGLSVSVLTLIVGIAHFLPFLAISVRRLHDTDRSGWWYLVNAVPLGSIVFLVLVCIPSTPGANTYGEPVDPEAPGASLNGNTYRQPDFSAQEPALSATPQHATATRPTEAPVLGKEAPSSDGGALIDRLERLAALRASGAIDEAEFAQLKASALDRQPAAGVSS